MEMNFTLNQQQQKSFIVHKKTLLFWPYAQYMLMQMVYFTYLAKAVSTKVKVFTT